MAAKMLAAYYSKGCDSEKLFSGLKISKCSSFKKYLNKFDVIFMDMRWIYGNALEELAQKRTNGIVPYIQEQIIAELREEYPDFVPEDAISLPTVLSNINNRTDKQFVIIIDEWDCIFREDKNNKTLQEEYVNLLLSPLKELNR